MNKRLCGAKTRAGTPCKRAPTIHGRCNLHGGRSLVWLAHPNYKHGWYSKAVSRSIIILKLNMQGYFRDSYAEYLELLRELYPEQGWATKPKVSKVGDG